MSCLVEQALSVPGSGTTHAFVTFFGAMPSGPSSLTLRFDVLGCRGELAGEPEHHGRIDLDHTARLLRGRLLEELDRDALAALSLHQTFEWPGRNGTSWLVTPRSLKARRSGRRAAPITSIATG